MISQDSYFNYCETGTVGHHVDCKLKDRLMSSLTTRVICVPTCTSVRCCLESSGLQCMCEYNLVPSVCSLHSRLLT